MSDESNEAFEKGLAIRRAVLGDDYVDAALANRNPADEAFQDIITRFAWGDVWSREGLPRKLRSMLTLSMLVALNRPEEFRHHVEGALRNGVTEDEIRELLIHSAVYCGVPAASSSYRLAREVFSRLAQGRTPGRE